MNEEYTKNMDKTSPRSVIEYIRRGIYEANCTVQPHHPALSQVLTPVSAKTLLNYISALEQENEKLKTGIINA